LPPPGHSRQGYHTCARARKPAVDTIMIFHQEDGKWKVWDAYLVGGQLVE
jgi:hypothetical protein